MMKPRPKHVHTAIAGASLPRHAAGQSPLCMGSGEEGVRVGVTESWRRLLCA